MTTIAKTQTITATEFKSRCLELMDTVRDSGTSITITKRGKPVARLVSIPKSRERFFASLPVTIVGDLIAPIDDAWDAEE